MINIICGTLIDGTGNVPKKNQVIKVEGSKIVSIMDQDDYKTQAEDEVIDLSSYTITPGFVDCHDHLCVDPGDEAAQMAESDAWLAMVSVANAKQILESGITTMRDCGGKNFVDINAQRAIEQGLIPGPRLITTGQPICRTGGHAYHLGLQADGEDGVREAVRKQLRMGAQAIKIMASGGLSTKGSSPYMQELSDAEINAIIDEAHRADRKVAAHVHGGTALKASVEAGVDSVEHGIFLTDEDLKLMAAKGTYLVITVSFLEAVKSNPDSPAFFLKKVEEAMKKSDNMIKKSKEYGVKIAVGTDTNHGRMDMELKALVDGGFTPMEAIVAATRNGADLCGMIDQVGTLQKGKWADLVAFEGNPLDDVSVVHKPAFVIKGGNIEFERKVES